MSVPGIVEGELDGEDVAARVSLSGGDEAFVTPTRTLVYRAEGLLSDESVEAFPHEADRLLVSEGRRKTKVRLEYPDGTRSFAVPGDRLHEVLEPLVAGVVRTRGVTEEGERIAGAFRFSELTLVVTGERLIRHIGEAVWDDAYQDYHFEDVTGLDYEEGSVATQVVLTVDGRKQRIKTPNDRTPEVQEALESSLFAYHDVASAEELAAKAGDADGEDGEGEETATDSVVSFGEGVDPLTTGDDGADAADGEGGEGEARTAGTSTDAGGRTTSADADASADADGGGAASTDADLDGSDGTGGGSGPAGETPGSTGGGTEATPDSGTDTDAEGGSAASAADPGPESGTDGQDAQRGDGVDAEDGEIDAAPFDEVFEPVGDPQEELREEVEELRAAVERQNELLARQQETLEALVERLREGE